MQARRSSLYVKKKPDLYFYDDFTTIPNGQTLNGKTPSGRTGHWQNTSYTTKSIKIDATNDYAVAADKTTTHNSIYAIPDGDLTAVTKARIKALVHVKGGVGRTLTTSIGFWSAANVWTGIMLYEYVSTAVDNKLLLVDSSGRKELFASVGRTNVDQHWELHVEKLSSTSIKVGAKIDNAWVATPVVNTVDPSFFAVPINPILSLRNNASTASGTICKNFLVDDQVDW